MSRLSSVRDLCSTWARSEAHLAPQRAVQVSVVTAMANVDLSGEMPTRRRGLLETCHHLFLRGLRFGVVGLVAGSEGASNPCWSPYSRSLGFFATGKMKRGGVDGGAAQSICDAGFGTWLMATWGTNDTITEADANV